MSGSVEPPPCARLFSAETKGHHFVWRGDGPGMKSSTIGVFDSSTEQWSLKPTTGSPPSGLFGGGSVCAGGHMYTIGGWDGSSRSFCNDMHKLDLDTFQWTNIPLSDDQPMEKHCFRLISMDDGRLCCFGGYGIGPSLAGSTKTFTRSISLTDGHGWTNEFHIFDVQNGVWLPADIKGERPPPCSNFTFTKVDQHRAVLFGGEKPGYVRANDVYLFDFRSMEATKLKPVSGESWPVGRADHSACCLNYGEEHPQLLIFGGLDSTSETLRDMWILDIDAGKWTEVTVPESIKPHHCQSTTATSLGPGLTEVLMFGGKLSGIGAPTANTTILRFESTNPCARKWVLSDVAHNDTRGSSQRLREKKAKIRQAAHIPSSPKESSSSQDWGRALEKQLQVTQDLLEANCEKVQEFKQKERTTQEQLHEKNQELSQVNCLREKAEKRVQELTADLQKITRRAQLAEERAKALETQWVVKRNEIRMSQEKLGGGGWGVVKVATFRGIEVAAKMLYEQIRTDYYQHLFIREMNMAARLRHPNLVQFIGATLEGEMIILTELMHTSLRRVLEGGPISRETIVSVSVQICQALNYLHLMQPDPVIHRDISSANVLLNPLSGNCWRAKVTDYGSVNTLRALHTENPGNPVYAAPEARIPSLQSPKMDIYSLGVLLMEMCTSQFPSDDRREYLLSTIQDCQFSDIITRCIDRERDNRPTALELYKEIQ